MLSIKSRKNSLISLRIIFFWWILVFGFDNIHSLSADAVTAGDVLYNTHGKRDPFVPLVSVRSSSVAGELLSVEKAEDVRLEGLVYDPQKGSIAILNGTVVA
ncbi:MAG: hypothetical protein WCG06_04095, partial [Candidatus Omnitrophota bacterium]